MSQSGDPPTIDSSQTPDRQRRSAIARWVFVVALVAFLVAALLGVFGLRDGMASASSGPYRLHVQYTAVSRSGLRGGWKANVTLPPGSEKPVTLAVNVNYVDMLEINRIVPEPSQETTDGDVVLWQFDPPKGDQLRVEVDADIPPDRHWGGSGRVAVRVDDNDVVAVTLHTRVFP